MDRVFYLEYSASKNFFHIDTIERIIQANRSILQRKLLADYVIIAGPGTPEEIAHKLLILQKDKKDGKW